MDPGTPLPCKRSGQEGRGESTEKLKTGYLVKSLAGTCIRARTTGYEKAKLIDRQESQLSNRGRDLLERTRLSQIHSLGDHGRNGGHRRKMLKAIWQGPVELANCVFSRQSSPPSALKGKWGRVRGVLCSRKSNKKRHWYEFLYYFSEVAIGHFLFPKLAQNSFLKEEQKRYELLQDSEVGALIRVTIVLYIYLCNCSIRSVTAGTEILMSFQCPDASRLPFFFFFGYCYY